MIEQHKMFIDGQWQAGSSNETREVIDPSSGDVTSLVCRADEADLNKAVESADAGFKTWKNTSPWDRSKILYKCARIIEERIPQLARIITIEQGKPLLESELELVRTVDVFEWCAAESIRTYGRLLPQRDRGLRQTTIKEPIGAVAGFSPWNFPAVMAARKIAAALGAGCSIVIKPSEEAPGIAVGLVQACHDAGVPPGVINLVFGNSSLVSEHLIRSPIIRKISLTGSVAVGRKLSSLAGEMLKPATMELGGHAPVLVFNDADIKKAAALTAAFKYRNAGQVCLGVSRVFVQEAVYDEFLQEFVNHVNAIKTGNGLDTSSTMGPMANMRGINTMERIMADATDRGAKVQAGGNRIGDTGTYWAPTVLNCLPDDSMLMTEEPFGPITPVVPFTTYEDAIQRANALDLGLAAYGFTSSLDTATNLADDLESGWIGINNFSPSLSEAPFGGMKDSGFGYEGGPEGFDAYCKTKFVSQANSN